MSFSTNLEDTPLAMKGLFRSRPRMSKLGSLEDGPWLPESLDPDISTSESLSPKEDDYEESSTLKAIRTQNEVPKDNAKLNLAAKTYQNDKKENKGNPFLLLGNSKNG